VRAQSPNALQKANDVDPGLVEVARDAFLDLFPNQENISGSFSDFRKVSQVNLTIWVTTVNILFEPQASIALGWRPGQARAGSQASLAVGGQARAARLSCWTWMKAPDKLSSI